MRNPRRRRLLKAALVGTGSIFWPFPFVFAQSPTALLKVAKQALVIGNSQYKNAPLRNPANDARGMAEELRRAGFEVNVGLELSRAEMRAAIGAHVESLGKTKAVGVFYFAGHGAQLAWRNYLIPVDGDIVNIQELRERAVDVNSLIEGIKRAGNPMNLIILDACRDNPFGSVVRLDQKGLSQLDAPAGTMLAYATAPGNTAIDGTGEHGLYTEHLLRQIRVPEAKVEDVFKRVRLNVRRQSKGLQIPWESTSLEQDFWFVPPQSLAAAADEEAERERRQQVALIERRHAEEEAERKRKHEQALQEARLAAEEAERKRKQELALLEQQRLAEEVERRRKQQLALEEAKRVADEAERKRREQLAREEARRAEAEAERKFREELALQEKRRAEEEAERQRREERAREEARRAKEEADRKYREELAWQEKRRAEEEAERQRVAAAGVRPDPDREKRRFEEELAIWEGIKESSEPGPLEEYLLRYPSGRFSELAQLRLDQVLARLGEKKIQVVSSPENPYSKGMAIADTAYRVGDTYIYRRVDMLTGIEGQPMRRRVTEVTDTEVIYNNGRFATDLLGNPLRFPKGGSWSPNQTVPTEFSVGKRWNTRFRIITFKGVEGEFDLDLRIVDREKISVPAGTFNAFRVEALGTRTGGDMPSISVTWKYWYAPEQVRRAVASEMLNIRNDSGGIGNSTRFELVQFRQS